jgi:hypothetical protein
VTVGTNGTHMRAVAGGGGGVGVGAGEKRTRCVVER